MEIKINKVFVYGTLMTDMHNHHLIKPFIKHLETAKTLGLLYDLPYGYPAMISGEEEVWGEIIELKDVKEALKVLDRLEGYSGVESPRNLYNRTVQEIQILSGNVQQAYVYFWANPDTINQLGIQIKYSWKKSLRLAKTTEGEKEMGRLYFAYGSCMDYEGRIQSSGFEGFERIGVARLEGYEFKMNKLAMDGVHVYANIIPSPEGNVYGVLYKITDQVEENYLNIREGYPRHYGKEMVTLSVGEKEYRQVLVYTAQPSYICTGFKPTSQVYEEELKRGAVVLPEPYKTSVFLLALEQCACVRSQGSRDEKEDIITALHFFRNSPKRENVFMLANALSHKILIIAPFIQKMIDLGYIRQDSRDTKGPYEPFATYYTVPAKRAEIDQLLRADKESSIISSDGIDCINADMEDKTLVCTHCWTVHRKGVKFCRNCFPIRSLDKIDTHIFDVILKLNQKGYPTFACCSGHATNSYGGAYFGLNMPMNQEDVPEGYNLEIKSGRSVYGSMPYGKRNTKKGQKTITKLERSTLEMYVKNDMHNLRVWADGLPQLAQ